MGRCSIAPVSEHAGNRRIDKIRDPAFVQGLADLVLEDLRARRDDCLAEREYLSLLRRLLQGRAEILKAEARGSQQRGDRCPLVDRLSEILADDDHPVTSRGEAVRIAIPEEEMLLARRRVERLAGDAELSDPSRARRRRPRRGDRGARDGGARRLGCPPRRLRRARCPPGRAQAPVQGRSEPVAPLGARSGPRNPHPGEMHRPPGQARMAQAAGYRPAAQSRRMRFARRRPRCSVHGPHETVPLPSRGSGRRPGTPHFAGPARRVRTRGRGAVLRRADAHATARAGDGRAPRHLHRHDDLLRPGRGGQGPHHRRAPRPDPAARTRDRDGGRSR